MLVIIGQRRIKYAKWKKWSRRWRKWASNCRSGIFRRSGIVAPFTIEDVLSILTVECPCCKQTMECGGEQSNSPTVDRINNDNGYTLQNIWIICHSCNSIKRNLTNPNRLYQIADAWWDRITQCK